MCGSFRLNLPQIAAVLHRRLGVPGRRRSELGASPGAHFLGEAAPDPTRPRFWDHAANQAPLRPRISAGLAQCERVAMIYRQWYCRGANRSLGLLFILAADVLVHSGDSKPSGS